MDKTRSKKESVESKEGEGSLTWFSITVGFAIIVALFWGLSQVVGIGFLSDSWGSLGVAFVAALIWGFWKMGPESWD